MKTKKEIEIILKTIKNADADNNPYGEGFRDGLKFVLDKKGAPFKEK